MNARPIPAAVIGIPQHMLLVVIICALGTLIGAGTADARDNTPTIRLFPTTVVEDLRQTSNVAREMETGLPPKLGRICFIELISFIPQEA